MGYLQYFLVYDVGDCSTVQYQLSIYFWNQYFTGKSLSEVKVSHRLTDSPACLVVGAYDMGAQMRQIMEASGQKVPNSKPTLEINPSHPLIEKLNAEVQEDRFVDLAMIVFDQAALSEGKALEDPSTYVKRINSLLMETL